MECRLTFHEECQPDGEPVWLKFASAPIGRSGCALKDWAEMLFSRPGRLPIIS